MNDIATLVRIFNPTPDDEYVDKRTNAIEDIATVYKASAKPYDFWRYADDILECLATGVAPEGLADVVEPAIKKHSSSFTRADSDLQMLVCALAAAYKVVSTCVSSHNGYTSSEIFTCALLAGLSGPFTVQSAALQECRNTLLKASDSIVAEISRGQRERKKIPDLSISVEGTEAAPDLVAKIKAGLENVLKPMKRNSVLDREELDLLWWAIGDWSEVANTRLSSLSNARALILSSFETANRLRRAPATSHAYIAMTKVKADADVEFAELRSAALEYRSKLEVQDNQFTKALGLVWTFPLLNAIFDKEEENVHFKDQQLPAIEWAKRLLIEVGTLRLTSNHTA